ncbi:MAG: hypothetical protein PUA83_05315 [Clostridiales bacterium]|nr:hypothetical protein [Clostridiales bacterium]
MNNKEERALAFVNMYAVLGALRKLCLMDEEAAKLAGEDVSVGISVKGGPEATLVFGGGRCEVRDGTEKCRIKLPFSSCRKFNGMIDGTVTPIPSRGFLKIGFLTGNFTSLTKILESYLRPAPEKLSDPEFFRRSTLLMLNVIASAAAQLGNTDSVGKASASYIPDGAVEISIRGEESVWLTARDHTLSAVFDRPDRITAFMSFDNLKLARDIFDGKANSVASVGTGGVRIGGMVPQVDNINRIFDRVALYLS